MTKKELKERVWQLIGELNGKDNELDIAKGRLKVQEHRLGEAPCTYCGGEFQMQNTRKAHRMIFDILRKTGCSIKTNKEGKFVICKERSAKDKDYDVYIEEGDEGVEALICQYT